MSSRREPASDVGHLREGAGSWRIGPLEPDWAKRGRSAKSPRIKASFFARDQPYPRLGADNHMLGDVD